MKLNDNSPDDLTVRHLRNEFIAGNDRAYSKIYELYAKDLYAFGLSFHAKTEMIEDAIHDIFVEIYSRRQNLQDVDNLKYYFLAAFRNRLFFLLKKDSYTFEITEKDTLGLEEKDSQEKWIEKENISEQKRLIKRLMSELNQNQREALHHRFVEGLSIDEISSLMNINYQSTKNLIYRSLKKLKLISVLSLL